MRNTEDDGVSVLFFCLIVAGIAFLLVLFLVPWPTSLSDWLKEKSPIEGLSLALTPLTVMTGVVALYLNGKAANDTLRHSQAAESAARFQKAVEMLHSERPGESRAGGELLEALGRSEQKHYRAPVIETLSAFAAACKAGLTLKAETATLTREELVPDDVRALAALEKLSALHQAGPWPATALMDGLFPLSGIVISGRSVSHLHLSRCKCTRWILTDVTLVDCDFSHTEIQFMHAGRMSFVNCNFTHAKVEFCDTNRVRDWTLYPPTLVIDGGEWATALVNGVTFAEWMGRARRPLTPPPGVRS